MNCMRFVWKRFAAALAVVVGLLGVVESTQAATTYDTTPFSLSTVPLFLTQRALPLVMLDMSRDHQLYFKAYDDYSDIDQDGTIDTTYKDSIDYYGYFDSEKCYLYSSTNQQFEPAVVIAATATDHYCNASSATSYWSGNFLNWATMTRIDTVRKILYGGYRSTDTASGTTLERSYLPNDAHSFAKYYNGSDLAKLTPFSSVTTGVADSPSSGITICNTTVNKSNAISQDVTDPPLMRVAKGNFALWAANERWQCRWSGEQSASNGNNSSLSGLYAQSSNPSAGSDGQKVGTVGPDFNVRVQVCVATLLGAEKCKVYPSGNGKPVGLLQDYGDSDEIMFGLMTGSYGKNKSGGVLRRQISKISNETNVATDGTFVTTNLAEGNIIKTLDKLRIYGYSHKAGGGDDCGTYFSAASSDNCSWGLSSFTDGNCSNWGNPQSEIYLEALRYLAGKTPTSAFSPGNSEVLGLKNQDTWTAPLTATNYCAALNIIQFNASTSSYDSDALGGATDIGLANLNTETDKVGTAEGITNNSYFIGETPADTNQLCTAKNIANLSTAKGTCPDAPRLGGSYQMAGLASFARTNDLLSSVKDVQTVKTFGVALSPASPRVTIAVPGSATAQKITLQPACRNSSIGGNCAIVDFKIVSQSTSTTENSGVMYVNWEDSEQGGDFDQDMWGVIKYKVTGSTVTVTTDVVAKSTGDKMGFGYVISGTTTNGFFAHSGINDFDYAAFASPPSGTTIKGCVKCNESDTATTNIYNVGASTAKALEQPLFYASKWGGFNDSDNSKTPNLANEWDVDGDGIPDNYFYSTNPAELASSLDSAFAKVSKQIGAGTAVSANSTRLDTGTVVYQAKFDSTNWSGQLQAYALDANTAGLSTLKWDASASAWTLNASNRISNVTTRKVYTCCDPAVTTITGRAKPLSGLSGFQQNLLKAAGEKNAVNAITRINWLRGDQSNEQPGGKLRAREYDAVGGRTTLLGDIVNSDPVFSGGQSFHYELLPATNPGTGTATGQSTYAAYVTAKKARTPVVFVAANDGMLHAFNADTGKELFAYMPSQALAKAIALTAPNYGTPANPHQYFVDGLTFVGDVYDGTNWKTVLIGSLGGGGKGIFALDVTNPTTFNENNVLFELTDTADSRLGYVLGQPLVARMADGRWAAIFGNGYNSTSGKASLFIVDIFKRKSSDTQLDILVLDTDTRTNNGLSSPALLVDGTNTVIAAYAGDLQGQLWKFDLSSTSSSSWGVAYSKPLFIARNAAGDVQPITATPVLGFNPKKGNAVMVYFGTGRYVATTDAILPTTVPKQSFYGIVDGGAAITSIDRSTLAPKTFTTSTDGTTRTVTEGTINWASWSGWYMDLGASTGERVISKAILAYDRVIFSTLIPSQGQCGFGGSGWLMELGGIGDDSSTYQMLANDGKFYAVGIVKTPILLSTSTANYVSFNDFTGTYIVEKGKASPGSGRMSWRQLQ